MLSSMLKYSLLFTFRFLHTHQPVPGDLWSLDGEPDHYGDGDRDCLNIAEYDSMLHAWKCWNGQRYICQKY